MMRDARAAILAGILIFAFRRVVDMRYRAALRRAMRDEWEEMLDVMASDP